MENMYKISKASAPKSFTKRDGSGEGWMQRVTLRGDDDGKEYNTTLFSPEEAFVGDIVEGIKKSYNEKYKEYQFTIKSVLPGPRETVNTPNISVESEKHSSYTRSPEENLAIVRQSTLKVVAELFSGKGDIANIGTYIAMADQMTEWCVTGTVTPRIGAEERANLIAQFGSEKGANFVAMNTCKIPFLDMLNKEQYEALVGEDPRM